MGKQFTLSLTENQFSLHLLFLMALAITNLRLMSTTDSLPPPSLPTSKSPPPPATSIQSQQFNNIIDALIGSGDFSGWVNILSNADLSKLPLAATLFIPGNAALSHLPTPTAAGLTFDPVIIPYHIVPRRLSFADLRRLQTHTRLPTLLPEKTLIISNNSPINFTIDDSRITHPDMYVTSTVTVHGIENLLDYAIYGDNHLPIQPPPPPEAESPPSVPTGEVTSRGRSDAACLCTEFPIVISVLWAAFAFKIQKPSYSLRGFLTEFGRH